MRKEAQREGLAHLGEADDSGAQRGAGRRARRRRRAARRPASAPRRSSPSGRPSSGGGSAARLRRARTAGCGKASTWPASTTASTSRVGPSSPQDRRRRCATTSTVDGGEVNVAIAAPVVSAPAGPGRRPACGSSTKRPGCDLLVGVRGGQHHAFAEAELHLARRQVGDHHGELADELLGRVGRLDAAEDRARARFADVERELAAAWSSPRPSRRRRSGRCAGRSWRSRRS